MRDLENYYQNYIDKNFDHILSGFRKRLIIDILKKYHSKNILEIGCGINPLFLDYQDFDHLTIVEPAHGFYSFAQEKLNTEYPHLKDKVELINATLQGAIFPSPSFDFILCAGLLGEIPDPIDLLQSIYKITCENTIVHVSAPNQNSFHRILAKESGIINELNQLSPEQIKFQRYHVFSEDSLKKMMNEVGFLVIDSETYFIKPFTHAQMMSILEKKIIDEVVLNGLNNMTRYMPGLGAELYVNARKK